MGSYKVEINAFGLWVPATYRYFKEKHKAENYRQRLAKMQPDISLNNLRVKKSRGKDKDLGHSFFMGFEMALLAYGFINTVTLALAFATL